MIQIEHYFHWKNIVAIIAIIILMYGFIKSYKKNKIISFSIFFVFAALFFAINLLRPVAGIVAPRLAFLSSAGFSLLFASCWIVLFEPKVQNADVEAKRWLISKYSFGLLIVLSLIYVPFTIHRNTDWKDIYTLLEKDMPSLDRSFQANRIALAKYHELVQNSSNTQNRELKEKCLQYSKQAHAIYDEHIYVEEALGGYYYQLGQIKEAKQQLKNNIVHFDTIITSSELLGEIYFQTSNFDSAAFYFKNYINFYLINQVFSINILSLWF